MTKKTDIKEQKTKPQEELAQDGDELEKEVAELKEQLLRALAEAENIRKQAIREREDASKYAITEFARDLLAVADNLRRAFDSMPEEKENPLSDEVKGLIQGVKMTEKELLKVFQKHGIQKITPLGEEFNHDLHQAMFEVETKDSPPGTIVDLMQPGYVMQDRLLRPALVGVSKAGSKT